MKNLLIPYLTIVVILSTLAYIKYDGKNSDIDEQIKSGIEASFTGTTFTGDLDDDLVIHTGSIVTLQSKTELDKFYDMKENNFTRSFNPPAQPSLLNVGDYDEKSQILNNYLTDNNFYFNTVSEIGEGYLYIELAQPIGNQDIFLYFHNSILKGYPVSGKVMKQKNLITGTEANIKFLYKLDEIWINKFHNDSEYSFDWLKRSINYTPNKVNFIGGYTTTSYGNQIKEIIITGK